MIMRRTAFVLVLSAFVGAAANAAVKEDRRRFVEHVTYTWE